jgi:predicted phosphodiesterase
MKLALVADVHGNLVALEAVLADLREANPDQVVHGGDLAFLGPQPAECVDRIRELGWPGVKGNTDDDVARGHSDARVAWAAERLGQERRGWLSALAPEWRDGAELALVHAGPGDLRQTVPADADDATLRDVYGGLGARLAIYCHIHVPYVRQLDGLTVANTGSAGLPFDGDPRASYLLVEDGRCEHRRVQYDVERAVAAAQDSGLPGWETPAGVYRTGRRPG